MSFKLPFGNIKKKIPYSMIKAKPNLLNLTWGHSPNTLDYWLLALSENTHRSSNLHVLNTKKPTYNFR